MSNQYQAKLFPTTTPASSSSKLGICVSGGGSRALSCALGQLSALNTIPDPSNPSQSLLNRAEYLSCVSGGTWASVLYAFLPEEIDGKKVSDDDFFITPAQPNDLIKSGGYDSSIGNIAYMNPYCMGTAPQRFSLEVIADVLVILWKWGALLDSAKLPWFWIAAIGEIILKPFGLYSATYDKNLSYIEPDHYFSLSEDYISQNITSRNPSLTPSEFYTCRPKRPSLIVNTNLLQDKGKAGFAQIPVQATPIHIGIEGASPDGTIKGGGSVDSFAFTSSLLSGGDEDETALVAIDRRYALCDIAGCSSAFFATFIMQLIDRHSDEIIDKMALRCDGEEFSVNEFKSGIHSLLSRSNTYIIPQYNYWTLGEVASAEPINRTYGFSDGGNFENTGLLGMLAQTDVDRIIVFVNSETPLSRSEKTNQILVDSQIPLLFGFKGDAVDGVYQSYGGMHAVEPMSYVQLFDTANNEFETLLTGLYEASCGGSNKDADLGTYTAAFTQTLTTVENPVANIHGGREIKVLWVYNNRVNQWQDAIVDTTIQSDLQIGQSNQNRNGTPIDSKCISLDPLPNFPYYSTGTNIYLSKEDVNMLAQLSAWNVEQLETVIADLLA